LGRSREAAGGRYFTAISMLSLKTRRYDRRDGLTTSMENDCDLVVPTIPSKADENQDIFLYQFSGYSSST
jgi:hypothetical protein